MYLIELQNLKWNPHTLCMPDVSHCHKRGVRRKRAGTLELGTLSLNYVDKKFCNVSMTSMPVTAQSGLSQMNPQARLCVGAYGED